MLTPRRTGREKGWIWGFTVAFLAITTTIVFAAETFAVTLNIPVKDKDGKEDTMIIKYEGAGDNVTATTRRGKEKIKISKPVPFSMDNPIKLGEHTKKIVEIRPGSVIVFEGSTCIPIPVAGGIRWIAYPPETVCP